MLLKSLVFSTVISAFAATGALGAERRWDLANEYGATSLHARTADVFIEEVARATNGEINITVHHGAALGYKSADQFDAVSDGALQLASSSFVFWTGIADGTDRLGQAGASRRTVMAWRDTRRSAPGVSGS